MKTKGPGWGIRNWIQLGIFALTVGIGIQFYLFVQQAAGEGPIAMYRPGGVEGFLPIGALMGWKRFFMTGNWDPVHPAAMVILGFAALISILFHKSFCSWFCPVGTLSEWMWKIGKNLFGKNVKLNAWIDYPLRIIKYFLLIFFLYIAFSMNTHAIFEFLQSPYYKLADVKMLYFFTKMSSITALILCVLTVGSLFVRNFWCRYFCPYGALMGLFAFLSPSKIHRNPETCIHCGQCDRICPSSLPISRKSWINSPDCTGCLECTRVCPEDRTLTFQSAGGRGHAWKPAVLGVVIVLTFFSLVGIAKTTGHWQSCISGNEFGMRLKIMNMMGGRHLLH